MLKYIYIRFLDYCNVGCKHCYLTGQRRKNKNYLNKKKIDIIFNNINYLIEKRKIDKNFRLRIYGGEILETPEHILEYFFNKFRNLKIKIEIQTSFFSYFSLNDKEIENKIKKFFLYDNLIISTSYDFFGIRNYNNSEEEYLNNLIRVIKILNKYNKYPILLITITKLFLNNEKRVYDKLLSIRKYFSKIQYNIYDSYNRKNDKLYLNNKEASEILINLFKLDMSNNFLVFDDFPYFVKSIKENYKNFSDYESACQSTVLTIEENLKIGTCPKLNNNEYDINQVKNFLYSRKRLDLIKFQKEMKFIKICKTCEFNKICNGGCPLKMIEFKNKFDTENLKNREYCPGFYNFLKYIKTEIQKGYL